MTFLQKKKDPIEELLNPELKNRLSFLQLLDTIRGVGKDRNVRALFIRLESEFLIGIGQCEELRTALLTFRDKYNKPIIVAYADNIGSWGTNAVRHYYIKLQLQQNYICQMMDY